MEQREMAALGLSAAAGLFTVLGGAAAVCIRRPGRGVMAAALGFAGGVMMTVSLYDLLPQAAQTLLERFGRAPGTAALLAACLAGMLTALLLDLLLPAAGGEQAGMWRLGLFSMLALMLHNLPEGIAVFLGGSADWRLGLSLAGAIALHNLPEGISVALPVMSASKSRAKAVGMAAVSGAAEPLGALLAWRFLRGLLNETALSLVCAGVGGLMLCVVCAELLPAAWERSRAAALAGVLGGTLVMLCSLCLLH